MPGPSGYTTAFTHPDPLDPNDAQRQRTQTRSPGDGGKGTGHQAYPYDQPVSYGKDVGAGMDGGSYQVDGGNHPPPGEEHDPDQPLSVWDRLSDMSDGLDRRVGKPVEVGMQGYDADELGYGAHGLKGESWDLEIGDLYECFRTSYRQPPPRRSSLRSLLEGLERTTTEEDYDSDDTYDPEEG